MLIVFQCQRPAALVQSDINEWEHLGLVKAPFSFYVPLFENIFSGEMLNSKQELLQFTLQEASFLPKKAMMEMRWKWALFFNCICTTSDRG